MERRRLSAWGLVLGWVGLAAAPLLAEEALPPGPPWRSAWSEAKRAGVRAGRPVFLYFTKGH